MTPESWGRRVAELGKVVSITNSRPLRGDESDRVPLDRFLDAARVLVPALRREDLHLGGTGIRARGAPAEQTFCDFRIGRDPQVRRLVQVAGIDSPGLTACLAIGREAADLVDAALDWGEDQR